MDIEEVSEHMLESMPEWNGPAILNRRLFENAFEIASKNKFPAVL